MSLKTSDELNLARWVDHVLESLNTKGYFYDSQFFSNVANADAVMVAARSLGSVFVPPDTDNQRPVISTRPSIRAPKWRPFDRRESIGWHNDFSTRAERPEVSLSWIRREDPSGPWFGAWRVASVGGVLTKLCDREDGRSLARKLSKETQPFGYTDGDSTKFFRVICQEGMRFYGRALTEGARLAFGQTPDHTREMIGLIEEAADAVGETLPASRGALLVVHNWFSLHDRTEQTVKGTGARRQAQLSFVKKLHRPLSRPCVPISMGGARA